MSFLSLGSAGSYNRNAPKITGVQVQTSVNTLPNAIFWGTLKRAGNLLEYTDFQKHKQQSGKGIGGKSDQFTYSASIILAVGEGQLDSIPLVIVNTNTLKTPAGLGFTILTGTWPDQLPWSYMTSVHPTDAFPYPGVIQVCKENYNLGSGAAVPNHNFLCIRKTGWNATWYAPSTINGAAYPALAAAFPSGIPTADLALVIQDFLTSAQYGVQGSIGLDTDSLLTSVGGSDAALQTYLRALGLGYCIVLDGQETAMSAMDRWYQLANCAPVRSGDKLKSIPYGTDTITGNGVTYVPNLTPVCGTLDDNAFIGDSSDDPVKIAITDPATAYNIGNLEITTDDGWFSNVPCQVRNEAAIFRAQGMERRQPTVTAHEVVGQQAGQIIAGLLLKRQQYDRNQVTFKVGQEYCLLEAMDVIPVFSRTHGLLNYRIVSAEEDDNGDITIVAQYLTLGTGSAVPGGDQSRSSGVPDAGITPSAVNAPIVFQPPTSLASPLQVWAAVSGPPDNTYGGADVYVSLDDDDYVELQNGVDGSARTGNLTANLPAYAGTNPDNTNTLSVDLSECGGELQSLTPSVVSADGRLLCYVDGELLSFATATLTAPNKYDLTGLWRGLFGTSPGLHLSGTRFARLDDKVLKQEIPNEWLGNLLYIKFASFNASGFTTQDLSVATKVTFTPPGIAAPTGAYAGMVWSTLKTNDGYVNGIALLVSVTPPLDANLILQAQYQFPVGGRYRDIGVAREEFSATSAILPMPGTYSVRVRLVTQDLEQKSSWVTLMAVVTDPFVGVIRTGVTVSTATFAVNNNDAYVGITNTSGAPIAAVLPSTPAPNQMVMIKDEGGNAGTNAITCGTVDGSTLTISINYGWVTIFWTGAAWVQV